ncbi:MAG: helix-turn-helix domain-containing protein, partial [Oscillospiraceae bacterium]|nr:helix-turn-helix domain-containing protein [Oscillospiraceae bacterium]
MSDKKNTLKDGDFINIQSWMVTELHLKGNELMIFAKIFGFSTTEDQYFTGRLQYLMNWTGGTKATVISNLNSLIQKGYIEKVEEYFNGVKFCKYRTLIYPSGTKIILGGYKNYT